MKPLHIVTFVLIALLLLYHFFPVQMLCIAMPFAYVMQFGRRGRSRYYWW